MINGEAFVDLAIKLGNGTTEAEYRTSVSRAYYGAFHVARDFLAEVGVRLPAGPESHRKLRYCLKESGEEAALMAYKKLESLRTERNTADYDLMHNAYRTRRNALFQIMVARDILDALATCRREPVLSRFRSKVRAYASQCLRLHVSD